MILEIGLAIMQILSGGVILVMLLLFGVAGTAP